MKFNEFKEKFKSNDDKIANVLVKSFASSLALVIVLVGSAVFVTGSTKILNATSGEVNAVSEGMSNKIGTYYESIEATLRIMGNNPDLKATIKALDEHKGKVLGDSSVVDADIVKKMQNHLDAMVKEDPAILSAYIATAKNQYQKSPIANFDPSFKVSERGWYKEIAEKGELSWTSPYQDALTGNTCVTVGLPVKDGNGRVMAILALDIDLLALAGDFNNSVIGEKGFNALVVKEGEDYKMIYSSKEEHQATKVNKVITDTVTDEATQTNIPGFTKLLNEAPTDETAPLRYPSLKIDGQDLEMSIRKDDSIGLYKVIAIDSGEYKEAPEDLLARSLIIGTVVGAVIMLLVFRKLKKIGNDLATINDAVSKLKEGDLTVEIEGDVLDVKFESGQLANNLNDTAKTLRSLIANIDSASNSLTKSALDVSSSASETNSRIEEIATTMNDIVEGISEQASHAEDSNIAVGQLAERLEQLKETSSSIAKLTEAVRKENEQGLSSVNDLKYYTEENNKSSKAVAHNINELSKKTESIESIVDTMAGIAEQTNLLSLNAAIEAARAGEHGAGFSVVAGEVKKLAEQSAKHSETIREIVTAIQKDVALSVKDMNNAIEIAEKQTNAVNTVVDAFETISNSTDSMNQSITDIDEFVNIINNDKDTIVTSVERIARVSQRSAASSQQISASIQEQTALTQTLADTAGKLNDLSEGLVNEVSEFKI